MIYVTGHFFKGPGGMKSPCECGFLMAEAENAAMKQAALPEKDRVDIHFTCLRPRVVTEMPEESSPDYHGPVINGKVVPDETHERFHKSVQDILAGRILPKAREQMRDALNRPIPDAPTDASTRKPMPGRALA